MQFGEILSFQWNNETCWSLCASSHIQGDKMIKWNCKWHFSLSIFLFVMLISELCHKRYSIDKSHFELTLSHFIELQKWWKRRRRKQTESHEPSTINKRKYFTMLLFRWFAFLINSIPVLHFRDICIECDEELK